ncbi:MAG TPA: MATE family efflux transporter [Tissierellaceae bacterium]|nr:MATE family efflux transporter [Tissierellaceae bacterium]
MNFWKDKVFLKSMIAIALPIALQNLISTSVNMVDTLMITSLGEASLAAVGLANQVFFFFALLTFGINSGSSILISQYWGKEDVINIRKILGLSLFLSTLLGIIFIFLAFFFPEFLMGIFIDDSQVVRLGADYLKLVSLSYIATAISFTFSIALRSTGRPNIPMIASFISFITNTIFNYILIFGKLGFPALGVKGAAIGTIIARLAELIFVFYTIYSTKGVLAAKIRELIDWNKNFINRYLKTVSPVVFNEGFWSLGQIMYAIAYASIGTEATAAIQLTTTIQNIFFVLIRGLASACGVMIGNKIGADNQEDAYDYAIKFISLSTLLGLVLGVVMALTPDLTLKLFKINPELFEVSRRILIIMGLSFFIRTYNSTVIVGVLRGGGDTGFSLYLEMGTVWLIGVPLAFIGANILNLPVYYVYLLVLAEDLAKFMISIPRVFSKKWIKVLT